MASIKETIMLLLTTSALATTLRPSEDPFYIPPPGYEATAPGTILTHRETPHAISSLNLLPIKLHKAHQILYRTTDSFDRPTATVTTLLIPHSANLSTLLSFQVAQDSSTIDCAPSYAFQFGAATATVTNLLGTLMSQDQLLLITAALRNKWPVLVPDFQGPQAAYLANKLAGRAVLDSFRAALSSSSFTDLSPTASLTMWGYSGGGLATASAAEQHPLYAPELHILGAAVGGAVPNISTALVQINGSHSAGLIPSGLWGLANEYQSVNDTLTAHLINKPHSRKRFTKARHQCCGANLVHFMYHDISRYLSPGDIYVTDRGLQEVYAANALGGLGTIPTVPMFVYKSVTDEISPVEETDELVRWYCSQGARVEYRRVVVEGHGPLAVKGAPSALLWLGGRMGSFPSDRRCTQTTKLTALADVEAGELLGDVLRGKLQKVLEEPLGGWIGL
ncbi:putative secretory lipase [Aspergillus candidus]|uniref:Putative secretory lipase n=1 Tax=Aspergillus candidus TaxID=41067 RepID=A0A2I2FAD2_ASPCN|nr:putative secretory lipase [Aspergillus candidus]PLB37591.1 putative secretory lipase [Aspergillus candidus]